MKNYPAFKERIFVTNFSDVHITTFINNGYNKCSEIVSTFSCFVLKYNVGYHGIDIQMESDLCLHFLSMSFWQVFEILEHLRNQIYDKCVKKFFICFKFLSLPQNAELGTL